jgi:hypothetical protein
MICPTLSKEGILCSNGKRGLLKTWLLDVLLLQSLLGVKLGGMGVELVFVPVRPFFLSFFYHFFPISYNPIHALSVYLIINK